MKKLSILFVSSFLLSGYTFGAACSYSFIETYKKGALPYVYLAEDVEISANLPKDSFSSELLYRPIKDVAACIASYQNFSAPDSCKIIFESAYSSKNEVTNHENGLVSNAASFPSDVYEFYKNYAGVPTDGSYYIETMKRAYLEGSGRNPEWASGGYEDFLGGLSNIAQDCREDVGIPTHVPSDFNPNSTVGVTFLDVFHGATLSCSFAANPGSDSTVRVVVPKAFQWCVKTIAGQKPHFVARIDKVDEMTGALKTVTASGGPEDFLNSTITASPKIFAQEGNNTTVNSLMSALDSGITSLSLANVTAIPTVSEINVNDVSSLDQEAFKSVAICEGGVDPNNYEADLADWYLSDLFSRTSLVSAETGSDGGYYRALYQQVLVNRALFPILGKIHENLKKGSMSWDDLYNWTNNGYAACYMNYPLSWIDALTMDYIVDGDVDNAALIPTWNADSLIFTAP